MTARLGCCCYAWVSARFSQCLPLVRSSSDTVAARCSPWPPGYLARPCHCSRVIDIPFTCGDALRLWRSLRFGGLRRQYTGRDGRDREQETADVRLSWFL